MASCRDCGNEIPDGQRGLCSMCMGDPDHGRDGYYRDWQEDQLRQIEARERTGDTRNPGEF